MYIWHRYSVIDNLSHNTDFLGLISRLCRPRLPFPRCRYNALMHPLRPTTAPQPAEERKRNALSYAECASMHFSPVCRCTHCVHCTVCSINIRSFMHNFTQTALSHTARPSDTTSTAAQYFKLQLFAEPSIPLHSRHYKARHIRSMWGTLGHIKSL